jgi:transcriptional regulator with XRE-family HTH domain
MTTETTDAAGPGRNGGTGTDPAGNGNGEAARPPGDTPYERAQRRLRVDGVAYGKALEALREERGWSVRKVSAKSGIPLTTVAKLLRGETESPDPEVACALAYTFGFANPGALLGRPGTGRGADTQESAVEGGPAGPGPLTLERLVESLLRGIWAAQGAPGAVLTAQGAEAEGQVAAVPGLPRLAGDGGVALLVGAVVLVGPKTLG